MSNGPDFKEASFVLGRLVRILKRKAEIELEDEDTGELSLSKFKLADDVDVDIDAIGEEIKAVIVDGKIARITPLAGLAKSPENDNS
ncbi:hypothetical protein J2P12_06400 [Candidatus Bathyarchaeota archaeon]|nr:hypothetical protein [Candidatus Bathyarchaeota archaeon]